MRMFVPILFVLLSLPCVYAQDKQAEEAPAAQPASVHIPLKAQVVLVDYDGTKMISSMPYMIMFMASHTDRRDALGSVRIGARVPVITGKSGESGTQYQYLDIGTNIDCWAYKLEDNRYLLNGTVDVSSVYTTNSANQPEEWKAGDPAFSTNPIISHSNGSFAIALHDGQTGEATVATDPITGHVFKVEVTLTVVK
jgi:hypothetical protein